MEKLSVNQRVVGLRENLSEEFNTHAVFVACVYLEETRHLKVFINYPLAAADLTFDAVVPDKKIKKFFDFVEEDLKINVYRFIKQSAKRYGYGTGKS